MKIWLKYILSLFVLLIALAACSDRNTGEEQGVGVLGDITVYCPNPYEVESKNANYSIEIVTENDQTEWVCVTDASWITIADSTGMGSGFINFSVTVNRDPFARISFLYIYDKAAPTERYTIQIRQKGYLKSVNSTITGDMLQKHRMGYGYDIKKTYMNDNSFSNMPILNYAHIVAREHRLGSEIITEDRRYYEEMEIITGTTLTEIQSKMTEKIDDKSTFLGCGTTSSEELTVFKEKTIEEEAGVVRLKQIVTSRTIDKGMLLSQNLGYTVNDSATSLLSPEFIECLNDIANNVNGAGDELINNFGTHLVVSADLGGVLDLKTTMKRNTSVQTEHSEKTIAKKLFGKTRSTTSSTYDKVTNSENLEYKADLDVYGGSEDMKKQLQDKVENRVIKGVITDAELLAWQESFHIDSEMTGDQYNAAMVNCRIIPLYDIIKDETMKDKVKGIVNAYIGAPNDSLKDEQPHGIFDVSKAIDEWDKNKHQQVLKISCEGQAVAIICKEYVPAISPDKPCIVAYPILEGKPFLYSGTFIGDLDHRPGAVRWVGNSVMYEPNDSISFDDARFNSLFDSRTHALKNLYLYWNSVQLTDNKFIQTYKTASCSIGKKDVSSITGTANDSQPLIKVGPYFWVDHSVMMNQTYDWSKENGYSNVMQKTNNKNHILSSDNTNYYNLTTTYARTDKVKDFLPESVRNSLPTPVQARSVMAILGGRSSVMGEVYQNDHNLLGLQWAQGFKSIYSGNSNNAADKEIKDCDTGAWLILTNNGDGSTAITRLSESGTGATYTVEDYFSSMNYSDQRFFKFFPLYICSDKVE